MKKWINWHWREYWVSHSSVGILYNLFGLLKDWWNELKFYLTSQSHHIDIKYQPGSNEFRFSVPCLLDGCTGTLDIFVFSRTFNSSKQGHLKSVMLMWVSSVYQDASIFRSEEGISPLLSVWCGKTEFQYVFIFSVFPCKLRVCVCLCQFESLEILWDMLLL